jgi:hypothetical protein
MVTRKCLCFPVFLVIAAIAIGQDNVKVNNKPTKEKKGMVTNNPEIKKSKKEMDAESQKFHKSKYAKEVKHGPKKQGGENKGDNKNDKQDKKSKAEEKTKL